MHSSLYTIAGGGLAAGVTAAVLETSSTKIEFEVASSISSMEVLP